jgi:hypothetical protein
VSGTVFGAEAAHALAGAYPEQPASLRHALGDHPLLRLDAIASLAARMRPADVQCCRGDVDVAVGRGGAPEAGLSPHEAIASIDRCGAWMVLKYVEQDPDYRRLLDALLAELGPAVRPATGPMLKREAFIFLSSPEAVTPFHFDPEHNILLQIAGSKVIHIYPAGDETLVTGRVHEDFHHDGRNGLDWRAEFAARGRAFALAAGDAVYVPVKAPHWIRNGDAPSVSLSITWRSGWSMREGYAHGLNRLLRRAGLNPRPPARFPRDNHLKALALRTIEKGRRLFARPH